MTPVSSTLSAQDFANAKDLKAQLEEINKKLEAFDKVNDLAEKKAWRLLYLGSLCLLVQLAIFLRFTYYEFSWDVMEPIGYLISLFYTLLGSWFFIYTKGHPFDLQPVKEWYAKTYQVCCGGHLPAAYVDVRSREGTEKLHSTTSTKQFQGRKSALSS